MLDVVVADCRANHSDTRICECTLCETQARPGAPRCRVEKPDELNAARPAAQYHVTTAGEAEVGPELMNVSRTLQAAAQGIGRDDRTLRAPVRHSRDPVMRAPANLPRVPHTTRACVERPVAELCRPENVKAVLLSSTESRHSTESCSCSS